jgi:tRNA pseudouridine55 synthase
MTAAAEPEGLLVIDKPSGPTSFDVIRALRHPLGTRALGHTGTLDPNASGVLCICAGWALKLQRFLDDDCKVYRADVRLGETTETDDVEGAVLAVRPVVASHGDVERALQGFIGVIEQIPPAYSAIKTDGERAYTRARRGERVALPARPVRIDSIVVERLEGTLLTLLVTCGKGTYIRSLARDLGEALGCGAHLSALRRLASGPFAVEQAVPLASLLDRLKRGEPAPFVRPMAMLAHLPILKLPQGQRVQLVTGQWVSLPKSDPRVPYGQLVRVGDDSGRLVAIAQLERGETDAPVLRPIKVRPGSDGGQKRA